METYVIKLLNNLELLKRCTDDCVILLIRGLYFVMACANFKIDCFMNV